MYENELSHPIFVMEYTSKMEYLELICSMVNESYLRGS